MMNPKSLSVRNNLEAFPTVGAAGRTHVLVLDDEPALRELFSAMLERLGCLATICSSSVEAIAAYRSAGEETVAFDCALIDLHIDEKSDGVTVGRMMREINPKAQGAWLRCGPAQTFHYETAAGDHFPRVLILRHRSPPRLNVPCEPRVYASRVTAVTTISFPVTHHSISRSSMRMP